MKICFLAPFSLPEQRCVFSKGIGRATAEIEMTHTNTRIECSKACIKEKMQEEDINGATYSIKKRKCYCLRNMSKVIDDAETYKSCIFKGDDHISFISFYLYEMISKMGT